MGRRVELEISDVVWDELQRRQEGGQGDVSSIVDRALREVFDLGRHTIFQVSTSNALAQGVFAGVVTVATLAEHGDFGLGTFSGLDGELILVDGHCYRATYGGAVSEAAPASEVPFAVVTRFEGETKITFDHVDGLRGLEDQLDRSRRSDNVFLAIRGEARFASLSMRAACPATPGEGLLEATRHQSEFEAQDVVGTIVGFWSPGYAGALAIPGYHFHFISDDRSLGGHVLELAADRVDVGVIVETLIHIAIPETAAFLDADLAGDHREAIESAETNRQAGA